MRLANQQKEHQEWNDAADDEGAPNGSNAANQVGRPSGRRLIGDAHHRWRLLCDWNWRGRGNVAGAFLYLLNALIDRLKGIVNAVRIVWQVFDDLVRPAVRRVHCGHNSDEAGDDEQGSRNDARNAEAFQVGRDGVEKQREETSEKERDAERAGEVRKGDDDGDHDDPKKADDSNHRARLRFGLRGAGLYRHHLSFEAAD